MPSKLYACALIIGALALCGCPPPNALHQITVNVDPENTGEVTVSPVQQTYLAGTEVTIKATPASGWEFAYWERAETNDLATPDLPDVSLLKFNAAEPVTTVTLYQDETLTAHFVWAALTEGNRIHDPGFEQGADNLYWTQISASFPNLICDTQHCGTVMDIGPHSGRYWLYFGGTLDAQPEVAAVEQTVTMPIAPATLQFYLAIPEEGFGGLLRIYIDDTLLYQISNLEYADYANYKQVNLDVSRVADGRDRVLRFEYSGADASGAIFIDDLSLIDGFPVDTEGEVDPIEVLGETLLPAAIIDEEYRYDFSAAGGEPPYTWSLVSDTDDLPAGFSM